jgi:hypothetical protein
MLWWASSLVDEAIWLQAFKKLEMYGYHFFHPPAVESHLFLLLFLEAFSLVRFFISYSCLIFYPAADFEHEKKIIINK